MKILIVSPIPLSYPPKDGYSMNVIYRSYYLKKIANIDSDIIVPENEKYPAKNIKDSDIFCNVFSYPINNKWVTLAKSFFSKLTYTMIRHDIGNEHLRNIITNISNKKYKAVIFDNSASYPLYKKLIKKINAEEVLYWSHNIDYLDFKSVAKENKNLAKKLFYYFIYKKLKKIEPEYIRYFNKIISVSSHEVEILKQINPNADVYWIPPMLPEIQLKVNKKYLSDINKTVENYKYKILFTGDLRRSSNVEPIFWFVNKVFPIIKNELNACFIIAGKDPSKELRKLVDDSEDIFLFSNVPDMSSFYTISDLVIVPIFNRAGIKLKLIEALKYKKKVVARPEALLGAGLENIVPNTVEPEEFAKKCIDTLEGNIDYDVIWKKFDEIYNNEKIIENLKKLILGSPKNV